MLRARRRKLGAAGAALFVATVGLLAASAVSGAEPSVETATFTNVVTYTVPTVTATTVQTVTETVTHTVTTTTPAPVPSGCTKELTAGVDLSTFLVSLASGDVGCLRAGSYTDGEIVSWAGSGATLTSYPGEQAEIVGTQLQLVGDDLTVRELTIRDTAFDRSCIGVNGARARIEDSILARCSRHGIILHTDSLDATVARNSVNNVGHGSSLSPSQNHGIYVQASGHRVIRNVFARPTGYGIHLYASPSNVLVSGNTAVGSETRTGIIVRTTGTGVVVVNNIFEGGTLHSCGGCVIDTNQVAGGWTVQTTGAPQPTNTITAPLAFADAEYRLAAGAAVDAARDDAVFPDRDGTLAANGSPDLGAHER